MSRDALVSEPLDDEQDYSDAVNDDDYGRPRHTSRADALQSRRRVETLLEERRLRRAIEDDWSVDEE
jgi:hypothetical protein